MRYLQTLVACTALLAFTATAQAEAITSSGKNDKIEWKVQSSWKVEGKPLDMVHSLDHKLVFILSTEKNVLVYDNKGVLQGKIPVGENVTAIDIAPQGESLYLIDAEAKSFTSVALSYVVDIDTTGGYFLGNPEAPVTIALFTDFECPYCSKLEPLLKQVVNKNKDNIKLVFKNMPLQFHKMADPAHRAALAAGEQGKFWEFHDKLFSAKKLSNELIDATAAQLGLDITKFKADMNSPKIRMLINKDLADAKKAGVTGTPTVFINGRKLQQRSMAGFQQLIDEELAKKK
jgi:protein-disulfide isomerase